MSKKKAFIFRGAPSSGKGTITKEFVKTLESKVCLLELDGFLWDFHLYNREISDVGEEEHKFAYENFLLILERYARNGNYALIIEGPFSWDKRGHGNMNDILEILDKFEYEAKTFFLKAGQKTLWARNKQREYSVLKDDFEKLHNYVKSEDSDRENVVNVENKTPIQTLKEIIAISS